MGAEAVNVPFLLGEANSASCGGQEGVSNAMASALWAVDFMMAMAQINVSRINFHGGGNAQYSWLGPSGSPDVKPTECIYVLGKYKRREHDNCLEKVQQTLEQMPFGLNGQNEICLLQQLLWPMLS